MEKLKNTLIDTGIAYDLITYQVAIDWSSEYSTGGRYGLPLGPCASAIVYPLGWFCVKVASFPLVVYKYITHCYNADNCLGEKEMEWLIDHTATIDHHSDPSKRASMLLRICTASMVIIT
jgi:hypothetical protein